MIPIVRTHRPESAVNLLLRRFQSVLVQAHYDNYTRIRFRADLVKDPRVFFGKVPTQIRKWHADGGCLISWRRVDGKEGESDAILFAEAPKSMEGIYAGIGLVRHLAVVYVPPTWRPHELTIRQRHADAHEAKCARQLKRLRIMRDVLDRSPLLTLDFLDRLLARQEASQPLSAPASLEGVARPPGISG